MTRNVEGPGASDAETFQGMPSTGSDGEAELRTNGHGGQVRFADLMRTAQEVPCIPRTRTEYANEINKTCGKSIESIIHRGLLGIGAERDLGRGDYGDMVKYDIRCSPGHMRKCKAIARNKFMVNRSNWNALPPSVAKLYPLSGIRPERLQILKEGGELHSKMKISDAVELAESEKGVYRPRPKQRTPAQRSRTAADLAEDDADNMESDTGSGSGSGDGAEDDSDREPDPERLAIDGEDLIEQFKIARAGGRRMVEYMRQHGDEVARGMLANGLRELANALNRDADQLDPPAPAPRARQRPKSKAKSKKKKRARS